MTRALRCLFFIAVSWMASATARAQVAANFTASPTTGCAPLVVSFTNTSTGSNLSYSWNFGNGNNSNLANPTATYLAAGTYTVTLTATGTGGSNTKTATITVHNAPTVSFGATPTAGCSPLTVAFSNASTANMTPATMTYLWNFGNGASSTASAPSYTYTVPGTYNVALAVTNAAGCQTTVVQSALVTVNTDPVAGFFSDTLFCGAPAAVTFTNTSVGAQPLSYAWSFGDGGTSTAQSPLHTYTTIGSFTVTLVVTDANGCSDTLTRAAYVDVTTVPAASFTGPATVCAGAAAVFTSTGTPAAGANSWDFGNSLGTATGPVAVYVYPGPGTYTVTNILTVGGCADTATGSIAVQALPVPAFTSLPQYPCPPPNALVSFTNTTPGAGLTYAWDFGDGGTSTGTSPTHAYGATGYYGVTLTATDAQGCVGTVAQSVVVHEINIEVTPTPSWGCAPLAVSFVCSAKAVGPPQFPNPIPYPSPIASVVWNFGDGSPTSTTLAPSHTYTDTGVYEVMVIVTTANGCTDTGFTTVAVGQKPTASFTASPLNICIRDTVRFTSTTTGPADNWIWFANGTFFNGIPNPVHIFMIADTFDIMLVASHHGCPDTAVIEDYIIVRGPEAKADIQYSCDTPRLVKFINQTAAYDNVLWYFGDGTTSTAASPTHLYPALGSYTASLVASSSATGCKDSVTFSVLLYTLTPDFIADDTAVCTGDSVTLTSTSFSTPPGAASPQFYYWRFGTYQPPPPFDQSSIKVGTPVRGYNPVRLIITDPRGCRDTLVKNQYLLFSRPQVDFTATPLVGCTPDTMTFADASSYLPGTFPVTRLWDYGDGTTQGGNLSNPSHIYTQPGYKTVVLTVTDNVGCMEIGTKNNYINLEDPVANFQAPSVACAGSTITLLNSSLGSNLTYNWSLGNGQTSTLQSPPVTYSTPGTYTIRLIAGTPGGCVDTVTKVITVLAIPQASFSISDTFAICSPHLVQFTNTTPGNHLWVWSLGGGATSSLQSPSHVYAAPGQYSVRLIAVSSPGGCRDTAYGNVTVLGFPGALSYGPSLLGCAPMTVNFSHTVQNVPSFVFDFADGSTLGTTGNTATHTYTTPGAYVPRLIMSDNQGCTSSSVGLDTIKVDGTVGGFTYSPYPACDRGTFTLTDTSRALFSTIVSRTWLFSGGGSSTAANPTQTYTAPGVYPVTLINVTSTGCRDTLVSAITVSASPIVSAGGDTVVCVGDATVLKPSGAVTYTWSPGATLSCTACTNPLASPAVPTFYIVTGRDAIGCTDTDTVLVGTKTTVSGTAGPGDTICRKNAVRLTASGGQTYQWSPAAGLSNALVASPLASPDTSTTYTVIIREGSCIPDTATVRVVVNPLSGVDAGPDVTIVAGTSTQLTATILHSPVTFTWSPDVTLSCATCPDPEAAPKNTTTYTVVARTDKGCVDSSSVQVKVICEQNQLFVPNTFTPNGDGENDRFYPRGRGIDRIQRFRIYDRWGALIFERRDVEANDEASAWDGTVNGIAAPPDVFVFIIEGTCDTGEEFKWQGDIALIK